MTRMRQWGDLLVGFVLAAGVLVALELAWAQEERGLIPPRSSAEPVPLNPQKTVLLDKPGKRLILKGEVCLREGLLEMLVCLKRTKEHEAIFAVDTKAQIVHAGLLALGLEAGHPVRFAPEYKPAAGPVLEISISWVDAAGKTQTYKGQDLVRNSVRRYWVEELKNMPPDLMLPADGDLRYDKKRKELFWYGPMTDEQRDAALKQSQDPDFQKAVRKIHESTKLKLLEADWVFSGSSFYVSPESGEKFYEAEVGDLICVANFSTATIDLSVRSTASSDDLLYEAYTERLPPIGTPVTIELKPRPDKKAVPAAPQKP